MMQASLSQDQPVSGGVKITQPQGSRIDFNDYRELTKLQEYISDEYCLVCAYFQVAKGHFGTCKDLPVRKVYDGAKKGSSCSLWRLRTVYIKYGISQRLPEKPTIRYLHLIVVRRRNQQYRTKRKNYWNKDIKTPWYWHRGLPKFVYDYLLSPEPLPDSLYLKETKRKKNGLAHKRKSLEISINFKGNAYVNAKGEPWNVELQSRKSPIQKAEGS
jgi:hypothetical protein